MMSKAEKKRRREELANDTAVAAERARAVRFAEARQLRQDRAFAGCEAVMCEAQVALSVLETWETDPSFAPTIKQLCCPTRPNASATFDALRAKWLNLRESGDLTHLDRLVHQPARYLCTQLNAVNADMIAQRAIRLEKLLPAIADAISGARPVADTFRGWATVPAFSDCCTRHAVSELAHEMVPSLSQHWMEHSLPEWPIYALEAFDKQLHCSIESMGRVNAEMEAAKLEP
jgi:hypothetical protein